MKNMKNEKNQKFIEATIALFHGVPILHENEIALDDAKLMKRGVFVTPEAKAALPSIGAYADYISETVGYDIGKVNNGLHKSFGKVKKADIMQLFVEQALHYMSVYLQNGLDDQSPEAVNSDIVYIPAEELNIEGEPVRVAVIRALSDREIVDRAKAMLSGMALSDKTQEFLMEIVRRYQSDFSLDDVRNKEFRIRLIDELGLMPQKASELLRFLVFKKTGTAMVVHSHRSVGALRRNINQYDSTSVIKKFVDMNGVEAIAKEFNRHRDFWVSLKKDSSEVSTIINKARKLSTTLNKPAKIGVLDRIGDKSVTLAEVQKELPRVTLWKKVSLANSMLRRSTNPTAEFYTVRTGRSYSRQNEGATSAFLTPARIKILDAIVDSIVADIRPNVEGKKIRLPEQMDYAFPTSEKMYVGNIPFWSTLTLTDKVVFGIHWSNVKNKEKRLERVDLDLHYTSPNHHIGWNSSWTDKDRRAILHSGDIVDAPRGASEAIYVDSAIDDDFCALSVNCFTRNSVPVPYTLFVGDPGDADINRKYLVGANEVLLNINGMEAVNAEDLVGFLESTPDGKKLHFAKVGLGNSIVSAYDENKKAALDAVKAMLSSRLSLRDVLERAGAVFELDPEVENDTWDIDLSIEALTKDSFSFLTAKPEKKEKVVESK